MHSQDTLSDIFTALTTNEMTRQMQKFQPAREFKITKGHAKLLLKSPKARLVEENKWKIDVTPFISSIVTYDKEKDSYMLCPCVRSDGKNPFAEFSERFNERYTSEKRFRLYKYYMRIHDDARRLLINDAEFEKKFMESENFNAVILSADIRDSSALVDKNSDIQKFAEFINKVIEELSECVRAHFGIYDKFTGDGILAVFPDFYSEKNAVIHALNCASECHKLYDRIYAQYESFFGGTEHGLGIGLSWGQVWQSGTETEFTTVGKPVVTACRLSGAEAGHTYISNEVWEQLKFLGKTECFTTVSDRTAYTAKGREYPMMDIAVSKDAEAQRILNAAETPGWYVSGV